jgi:hypothetical protein
MKKFVHLSKYCKIMVLKKLYAYSLLLFVLVNVAACTTKSDIVTLASILTQGSGTWKVAYAKFGDEEAPAGMYDGFTIQFKSATEYITVNPKGAITPASLPTGQWKQGTGNIVVFDGNITVREVSSTLSSNKIVFEWEVSIPGKVTTTYRIELVRA